MKKRKEKILSQENIVEYFKKQIDGGVEKHSLTLAEDTKFYVVNMLSDFYRTDKLYEKDGFGYEEAPLAELLSEALKSQKRDLQVNNLRKIGDRSLYISGCFQENLKNKLVNFDYYASMGIFAYRQLSNLIRTYNENLSLTYNELHLNFLLLVDMLDEIFSSHLHSNKELLKIYERWLTTSKDSYAKILSDYDIVVGSEKPKKS